MTNEEHHEYLCEILAKLVPVLDCDELETLARCTGIRIDEFYEPRNNENEHSNHDSRGIRDRKNRKSEEYRPFTYLTFAGREEASPVPF